MGQMMSSGATYTKILQPWRCIPSKYDGINGDMLQKKMCLQRNMGKGNFFKPRSDLDEIAVLTPSPDFGACFENTMQESDGRQSASARPSV